MQPISSSLLPVRHGFSTREGGVSQGPYASLNLGFSVGDDASSVEANLRRLARAASVTPSRLLGVSQVHGDRVVEGRPLEATEALSPPLTEADGLWTQAPGHAVGVKTADCVPLLLVHLASRKVAAVHSGWRGTDAKIAARAIEALAVPASEVLAAIGPCIRECCYQVSPELAQRFQERFDSSVVAVSKGTPHLHLVRAVSHTLREVGVPADQIDTAPALCTACDGERFFSHRRDGGKTGRHLSYVVCDF